MKKIIALIGMLWASVAAMAGISQGRINMAGTGDTALPKAPVRSVSQPKPYNEVITAKAKRKEAFLLYIR